MQKFWALEAPPPDPKPPAAVGFAPYPHWPPATGGPDPDPQNSPHIANIWLRAWVPARDPELKS